MGSRASAASVPSIPSAGPGGPAERARSPAQHVLQLPHIPEGRRSTLPSLPPGPLPPWGPHHPSLSLCAHDSPNHISDLALPLPPRSPTSHCWARLPGHSSSPDDARPGPDPTHSLGCVTPGTKSRVPSVLSHAQHLIGHRALLLPPARCCFQKL